VSESVDAQAGASRADLPTLQCPAAWVWDRAIGGELQGQLEAALARQIVTRRWFGGKARTIRGLKIVEAIAVTADSRLLLVEIEFAAGPSEIYQIPLGYVAPDRAKSVLAASADHAWVRVLFAGSRETALLIDPLVGADFCRSLLALVVSQARLPGLQGEVSAWQSTAFHALADQPERHLAPSLLEAEQSNTSVLFGEHLILKLYRRVEMGANPDVEIAEYLTSHEFAHTAALAGAIEYRRSGEPPWTLAALQAFIPNQGDAWRHMLARMDEFLTRTIPLPDEPMEKKQLSGGRLQQAARQPIPPLAWQLLGRSLNDAELLGTRTAELHLTLAMETNNPDFVPEPFSKDDQTRWFDDADALTAETFSLLREQLQRLEGDVRELASRVLAQEPVRKGQLRRIASEPIHAAKIRCHGDFHLGQVLVAGDDFVIIDFEGEPSRPLSQRREKRLALRDVAGMIRSFHYAACSGAASAIAESPADGDRIQRLAQDWYHWMSLGFLGAYLRATAGSVFLPASDDEFDLLLDACLLEKAVYELRYELNNRPDWLYLPLGALIQLLSGQQF
jgi:maltose alpha-D-glucosyltransferase/alpha-amylase